MIAIEQIVDQPTIDSTQESHDTETQEIKLCFCDSDPILEVINDKYENGSEKVNRMDNGQGQIKLCCSDSEAVDDHYEVPF